MKRLCGLVALIATALCVATAAGASLGTAPVAGPVVAVPIDRAGHTDTEPLATSCPSKDVCHDLVFLSSASTSVVAVTRTPTTTIDTTIPAPPGSGSGFSGRYSDISCPAVTWCGAVGPGYDPPSAYPSPVAAVLADGTWSARRLPLPPDTSRGEIRDVSCWAVGSCLAVGVADAGERYVAWIDELVDGTWAPDDAGLGGPDNRLDRVSCTAKGCTAIGDSSDTPVAITRVSGSSTWTAAGIPLTAAVGVPDWLGLGCSGPGRCVATARFEGSTKVVSSMAGVWSVTSLAADWSIARGVDCPAPGRCVLVGSSPDGPAALVQDDDAWIEQALPVAGAQDAFFQDVSCATVTTCSAVGNGLYAARTKAVIATLSAGVWTAERPALPLPPRAHLTGVACTSASNCHSVGYSYDDADTQSLWTAQRSGDSWSYPLDQPADDYVSGAGIDCPGPSDCVATSVDESVPTGRVVVFTLSAGRWIRTGLPLPLHGLEPHVTAPSCTAIGACVILVSYEDTAGSWHLRAYRSSAGRWTAGDLPARRATGAIVLDAVACATDSWCAAVGFDAAGMFAEILSGGQWRVRSIPTSGPWLTPRLVSLDCPAVGACRGAGSTDYDSADGAEPLTARLVGGAWSANAAALGADTSSAAYTGVSCAHPGACAAVGYRVDAGNGFDQPLAGVLRPHGWARYRPALPAGLYSAELSALDCVATTCRAVGQGLGSDGGRHPASAAVRLGGQ